MRRQARYFPVKKNYGIKADLKPVEDKNLFEFDENYYLYIEEKELVRKTSFDRHHETLGEFDEKRVNRFVVNNLHEKHRPFFLFENNSLQNMLTQDTLFFDDEFGFLGDCKNKYFSGVDALASQLQADIMVNSGENGRDYNSLVHVSFPSFFNPVNIVGKSFYDTHRLVPGMEKISSAWPVIRKNIIDKGPFVRFNWGLSRDSSLNLHPERELQTQGHYLRVERTVLSGANKEDILFFVQPYIYPLEILSEGDVQKIYDNVMQMSDETRNYKNVDDDFVEYLVQISRTGR